MDEFDFNHSSINKQQVLKLADPTLIDNARNIIFIGGTGTGKTHMAIAIAKD